VRSRSAPGASKAARLLTPILWWGAIVVIVLFLVAPIIVVVIGSFSNQAYLVFPPRGFSLRWYGQFFGSREFIASTLVSLRLGALTMVISTALGVVASMGLVDRKSAAAEFVKALFAVPLMVPGIVTGIAMLFYFTRIRLGATLTGLVIAHVALTLPFVVRIVLAGLESLDRSVGEAARSLGANQWRAAVTITLPMIRGNVLSAAIFAFIISFDEVVVTLFLASPRLTTLPVRIYNYIEFTSDPSIAAISTILVAVSACVVLIVDRYVGFTRLF
jgi:putative spermidine/putrescine transport system permease protein